ncbi:ABC transporter permease [Lacunimicrobium album]
MSTSNKKILGILALFVVIVIVTAISSNNFFRPYNIENLIKRISPYTVISIGAALVIITGGIDLSIGSVIALSGTILPYLLVNSGWSVAPAIGATLGVSALIGLMHGLLITKLRLQPFIVTLFGLLFYRGIARWLTNDQSTGFGNQFDGMRDIVTKSVSIPGFSFISIPNVLFLAVIIAVLAWGFLNKTIFGRYLLAIGRNEQAARFSGIHTDRYVIMTYILCSFLAGLGGILFALETNSVQPSGFGNFYELYAIAAAVLGGCSLRGGEGTILGTVIGAGVLQLLRNSINLLGIPSSLEYAVVGGVILIGATADELFNRLTTTRRTKSK